MKQTTKAPKPKSKTPAAAYFLVCWQVDKIRKTLYQTVKETLPVSKLLFDKAAAKKLLEQKVSSTRKAGSVFSYGAKGAFIAKQDCHPKVERIQHAQWRKK